MWKAWEIAPFRLFEAGLRGLWRGAHANVARAALLSAGQLASYDQTKQAWSFQWDLSGKIRGKNMGSNLGDQLGYIGNNIGNFYLIGNLYISGDISEKTFTMGIMGNDWDILGYLGKKNMGSNLGDQLGYIGKKIGGNFLYMANDFWSYWEKHWIHIYI